MIPAALRACIFLISLLLCAPIFAAEPIPPTQFRFPGETAATDAVKLVAKQTGWKIDGANLPTKKLSLSPATFWGTLDALASETDTHLVIGNRGEAFSFAKGKSATPPSHDGPFRIAAKQVTAKADAVTGQTNYTLSLDLNWEPRFPVFRVSGQPKIASAKDDRGETLKVPTASVNSAIVGYSHVADVAVQGLSRDSKKIANISGEFAVTAAPKMIAFAFDDITKEKTQEIDGVKCTLRKLVKRDEVWEFVLELEYPKPPPNFESFETWTNRNAARLISPDRTKSIAEDSYPDITERGKRVEVAHRFLRKTVDLSATGWQFVYEAPAPLVEFAVKFELKEIPLP